MLPEGGIEQLQTENQHHEKRAHNLPRSALRKPAVDPGKDGTHQQNVKGRKEDEDNGRPEKESRLGNGDSDKDAEAAKEAENGGNVCEPEDEIEEKEGAEAYRKTQQGAEIELLLKGGEHDGHDLPHEADAPEDDGQVLPLGAGSDDVSVDARADTDA